MEIRRLNALRGIAALIVVISHYSNYTLLLNGVFGLGAGQLGVMLFFILSGFLMSFLYIDQPYTRSNVGWFAVARVARVIPLFLAVVVCSYLLERAGTGVILYQIPDLSSLASHLLLMSGTSVLWTIPAEIDFYLLFVLFWWLHSRSSGLLYVLFGAIFLVLMFFNFPRWTGTVGGLPYDIALLRVLPYFFVGMAFGELYLRWRPPASLINGIFVAALVIVPMLYPQMFKMITGHRIGGWGSVRLLLAMSMVFFCVVFLVPDSNRLLANRVGDFLGRVSYSLYLLHLPLLQSMLPWVKPHPWLFLPVFLAATLVVAQLSYVLLEHPCRLAIRSLAAGRRGVLRRTPAVGTVSQ